MRDSYPYVTININEMRISKKMQQNGEYLTIEREVCDGDQVLNYQ